MWSLWWPPLSSDVLEPCNLSGRVMGQGKAPERHCLCLPTEKVTIHGGLSAPFQTIRCSGQPDPFGSLQCLSEDRDCSFGQTWASEGSLLFQPLCDPPWPVC